ncbi:hypothetical protein PCG10_009759 [Penicillium crustosum]|uniref:Uncharacterized protein n=1 Tax=Penicillium crustosum TaxID=36656 RepID=A0A9P5GGL8_PENCR|nr:hypothetical protein PCG10_009759 [Penicillium crustosum]
MSTPEDTSRAESSSASIPGSSTQPTIITIRGSTQHRPDNTPRADITRHTEIYTDNPGHASRFTDAERQRLEALAVDSRGGAIFVTYDLIDTLMADGTRRTDEALVQYLLQDDTWEAVDTINVNITEIRGVGRDGDGNGRQGDESELKLTNGTERAMTRN